MPSSFNTAITLMVIGMTTVFFILALVVVSGNALIHIVNRFFAEEKVFRAPVFVEKTTFPKTKLAIILAVVEQITQGKGEIIDIKKIEDGQEN